MIIDENPSIPVHMQPDRSWLSYGPLHARIEFACKLVCVADLYGDHGGADDLDMKVDLLDIYLEMSDFYVNV